LQSENGFLKSPTGKLHTIAGNSRDTASLDELAEPNYYSNSGETSSTHVFASQLPGSKAVTKFPASFGIDWQFGGFWLWRSLIVISNKRFLRSEGSG
jgi:hypothetical protein